MYSCKYKGKKEKCLASNNEYPVTKNNKIDKKRVRAAAAYASRFGDIKRIKRGGICKIAKREKIDLKVCS